MGKHVCPVCETVYAQKGVLKVESEDQSNEYESWRCTNCDYRFISLTDLQDLLDKFAKEGISISWRQAG